MSSVGFLGTNAAIGVSGRLPSRSVVLRSVGRAFERLGSGAAPRARRFRRSDLRGGLAIVRTGALPRALGWILLVQSAAVGLVFFPAQYFRVPGASVAVLIAMMVFFLWLVAAGVALLRWRPPAPA